MLVCTDRGEILFCDSQCEFKFMLVESPGANFRIQKILALKGDDFIIANDTGSFFYYESTGELRNPFKLFRNSLPTEVDSAKDGDIGTGGSAGIVSASHSSSSNKWSKYLEEQDGTPFFPSTGMEQIGDYLVYTTKKRQLLKMRI